ncbi:MAG: ABC-type Na+ efflux pump permease subunit [Kiritimatiellia bacterium]|jgi:ABC-type Na+ efflux pump permease subunit
MMGVILFLFVAIAGFVVGAIALLDLIAQNPDAVTLFEAWFPALGFAGMHISEVIASVIAMGNFLLFTQYLGISSVLAGHTVLHDRQCHTLPFLLLAPVTRLQVLLGKVLGAIGLSTITYIVLAVLSMGIVSSFPVAADQANILPRSSAWWIAVLLGGPLWALGVASICTAVSAIARDVRTAQQTVAFVMFFSTFTAGSLLAGFMADGPVAELVIAAMGGLLAVGALAVGVQVVKRDLSG